MRECASLCNTVGMSEKRRKHASMSEASFEANANCKCFAAAAPLGSTLSIDAMIRGTSPDAKTSAISAPSPALSGSASTKRDSSIETESSLLWRNSMPSSASRKPLKSTTGKTSDNKSKSQARAAANLASASGFTISPDFTSRPNPVSAQASVCNDAITAASTTRDSCFPPCLSGNAMVRKKSMCPRSLATIT